MQTSEWETRLNKNAYRLALIALTVTRRLQYARYETLEICVRNENNTVYENANE